MAYIDEDNSLSIGSTPPIRRNPAYPVKCRIGAALFWDAERLGLKASGAATRSFASGRNQAARSTLVLYLFDTMDSHR